MYRILRGRTSKEIMEYFHPNLKDFSFYKENKRLVRFDSNCRWLHLPLLYTSAYLLETTKLDYL